MGDKRPYKPRKPGAGRKPLKPSYDAAAILQEQMEGYRFKTISGLPFSYKIKTGRNGELTKELWIDRRESSKSLTWSSVLLALGNIKGEVVDRPKALGDIRGVTYIFGMFYRFGLIDVPDEVKEKMKHPKQNTGKQ